MMFESYQRSVIQRASYQSSGVSVPKLAWPLVIVRPLKAVARVGP